MGYLGRRIGLSQDQGDSNPGAAGGAVGGGLLDLLAHGYFERQAELYNAPGVIPAGLTATGGVISDYTSGPAVYRAHIFTSSGALNVTAPGTFGDTVDILVVGSGGGGGTSGGGGGGGGVRYLTGQPVTAGPTAYTVTINGGGVGVQGGASGTGDAGGTVTIGSAPQPINITSPGGGGGGSHNTAGASGASGGGTGRDSATAGTSATGSAHPGVSNADVPSAPLPAPAAWFGHAGGQGPSLANANQSGGGGGGAAEAGARAKEDSTGKGGDGAIYTIANGANAKYGAGGGGGRMTNPAGLGGATGYSPFTTPTNSGKGGHNPPNVLAVPGQEGFGGGGGGGAGPGGPGSKPGGNGGSGTVVVRYQIASIAATAKASGGAISFYSGKTIHAFTSSGTFATAPNWTSATVEYVVIGGGGGGAYDAFGGGGGAGAYRTGTTPIGAHPVSTTIQVGGGGIENRGIANPLPAAYQGTSSYFGTPITSPGGGGGAVDDLRPGGPPNQPDEQGMAGGSGGGNALDGTPTGGPATGAPFPGTIGATPPAGWGHPGGVGSRSPIGGGGGGGAGAAGAGPNPKLGGDGIQLPSTFRNPVSTVGAPGPTSAPTPNGFDTSGKYWVAGGGAGGQSSSPPFTPALGTQSAGGGGYYSTPANPVNPDEMIGAIQNTGSGGGSGPQPSGGVARNGGSGIVLIAYPS